MQLATRNEHTREIEVVVQRMLPRIRDLRIVDAYNEFMARRLFVLGHGFS